MTEACKDLIEDRWTTRAEDLEDPEYEALGFDYVEPNTFEHQVEGYWRWQFSWGGPAPSSVETLTNTKNYIA